MNEEEEAAGKWRGLCKELSGGPQDVGDGRIVGVSPGKLLAWNRGSLIEAKGGVGGRKDGVTQVL